MKSKITIQPSNQVAYIPNHLIKEGYVGQVETLANAATVTLLKPGVPLRDIKRSLEIVIQDVELRMKGAKR